MFMLPLFAELVVVCFCCHCLLSWLWYVLFPLFAELVVVWFCLPLFADMVIVCLCCPCLLSWFLSVHVAIVC